MKRLTLSILGVALLCAPAAADNHEDPVPGATPGTPAPPPTAEAGVGPFSKTTYPTELIQRPLTLPAGMVEATPVVSYAQIDLLGSSFDATAVGLGARYGITDQIQAGLATAVLVDPDFEWSETINLTGAFLAFDTPMIDIAPSLTLPLSFIEDTDVLPGVILGADTRLVVHDKVFVLVGQGLLPIAFDPSAINLDLNTGVGFQITYQVAVTLTTQLASIAVSGDGNETTTLGDFIPVNLTGLFAINNMVDVFLQATFPSIEDAGDFYAFSAGANVRL